MAESPLVVVGHCTSTSARIFVCTGRNRVTARIAWRADGGAVASADLALAEAKPYRIGVFDLAGLTPAARVEYAVAAEPSAGALPAPAAMLAPAAAVRAFRLLPVGRPPRVALVSCNGWYQIAEEARRFAMWRRLRDEIAAGGVDLVVYAGDQIYADPIWMEHDSNPANDGLTPASQARVAALTESYRQWYFRTWSHRATQEVLASCPSVMTWDDHDIYDGWGSNDDDTEPPQQAFFAAARRAFLEFQTLHGPPSIGDATSSAWGFAHAGLGVLALDTRTNRMWTRSTVLGEAQHAAIGTWLAANAPNLKHLLVVSSIPPVHANVAAALALMELSPVPPEPLDDLRDAWVAGNNRNELQRLMLRLFGAMKANPGLRVTIASGDVHVGTLGWIESRLPAHARPDGSRPRIHQIVSSGIGHPPPSGIAATLMSLAIGGEMELGGEEFRGRLVSFPDQGSYVLSRRNFATISFTDPAGAWLPHGNVRVAFHAEGEAAPIVRRLLGT